MVDHTNPKARRPVHSYDIGGAGERREVRLKLYLSAAEEETFRRNAAAQGTTLTTYIRRLLYQDDAGELLPMNDAVRSALRMIGEAVGGAAAVYAAQAEHFLMSRAEIPFPDRPPAQKKTGPVKPWS